MGKISTIFRIFKSATPAEKIAKAIEKGRMPSIYAEDLKLVENVDVREALTEQLAKVANKTSRRGQMKQAQINEITWKLNVCDDLEIKSLAEELLIGTKGKSRRKSFKDLFKAEHLLDVVNTAKEKYCRMFSNKKPLGDTSIDKTRRNIEKYRAKGNAEKLEEGIQDLEKTYSEPRKIFRIQNRQGHAISDSIMENENKFSSLREFIEKYPDDKETATYLWKKYFVNTQEPKFQKIMNEIYDKYGVRVVTNNETTLKDLIFLENEFKIYQTASKGEAKFPVLFDIRTDYEIIKHGKWVAHTNSTSKIVNTAHNIQGIAPRHELAHMQDNSLIIYNRLKKVKRNEADRQELLNAGISEGHADYFFKNERESWAVFAQGDMSAYSEAFKEKMINKRKGLPAWITNLTHNSVTLASYKAMFPGKKNERMISEIQEVLGDNLPCISTQKELKLLYKMCKKIPKGTKINPKELNERFFKELEYMKKCKKEAIDKKKIQKFNEEMQKINEETNAQLSELEKLVNEISAEFGVL